MTLWIDDGTPDGFLANCGNCAFAVEDPTENALTCGWDPPVLKLTTSVVDGHILHLPVWEQPEVPPDMHCHHHPAVQRAKDFGRGWQKGLRRPEDRDNRQHQEERP